MDDEELEKLAMEEILKETKRGAERAKEHGALGWQKCPLPATNKRFLKNMLVGTLRNLDDRKRRHNDYDHEYDKQRDQWKARRRDSDYDYDREERSVRNHRDTSEYRRKKNRHRSHGGETKEHKKNKHHGKHKKDGSKKDKHRSKKKSSKKHKKKDVDKAKS
ncbi:protein POLR1D-like [Haliotis rubra]|uniref:protein POLR1D-like n=1 Tax=Haliotis rubra TaxID=36100 RepID=UPI001EE51191|nr:protein POLR1D-like [Haliotis rubra]